MWRTLLECNGIGQRKKNGGRQWKDMKELQVL